MGAWLAWAFACLGLIYLVTEASITFSVRLAVAKRSLFGLTLIYCPACSGFWLGLGLFWLFPFEGPTLVRVALSGLGSMVLGALWKSRPPAEDHLSDVEAEVVQRLVQRHVGNPRFPPTPPPPPKDPSDDEATPQQEEL